MKKIILILLLMFLSAFANIGNITFISGQTEVLRQGESFSAKLGDTIFSKDLINTGKNSKMQIVFNDKTVITIGSKAKFSVDEYYYDKDNSKENKLSMNFSNGFFKTITGQIGKLNPSSFKLNTKTASIGIRGTQISMTTSPKSGDFIACTSGEISVSSLQTGTSVIVPAGMFTSIKPGSSPTKPKAYSKKQLSQLSSSENSDSNNESEEDSDSQTNTNSTENVSDSQTTNDSVAESIEATVEKAEDEKDEADDGTTNDDTTSEAEADDDTTNASKQVEYDGVYLKMGYWLNDSNEIVDTYIDGERTPNAKINEYKINKITAEYNGSIRAIHTHVDGTSSAVGGTAKLNVDFGKKIINGEFVIGSTDWKVKISDITMNSNGFNTDKIDNNGSSTEGITGKITGRFYGPNAENMGGSIDMNSTNNGSVKGSYATAK